MVRDTALQPESVELDKSALDAALQACVAAIKATEDEYDTTTQAVNKAREVLREAEESLASIINRRGSLQRAMVLLANFGEEGTLALNPEEAAKEADDVSERLSSNDSTNNRKTLSEPTSPTATNEHTSDLTATRKRLGIRPKLVELISDSHKFQSAKGVYDLAKDAFGLSAIPDSTVNSSLSALINEEKLLRFPYPPNAKRGSLYGLPEWFQDGKPKLEYIPKELDLTQVPVNFDEKGPAV